MSSQQICGQVKVVSANLSYQWDYDENISNFSNNKVNVVSPKFYVYESQWRMELHPIDRGEFTIFLVSENLSNMELNYKFLIKNYQDDVIVEKPSSSSLFLSRYGRGCSAGIRYDSLPKKFYVICEIAVDEKSFNKNRFRLKTNISESESLEVYKVDGLENLLNNEKYSDFKFIIDGKELYVHKNILAVRSTHFERIFEQEKKNEHQIEDIKYDVFYELLRFLYTGKISQFEYLEDLLITANKYNLQHLKIVCENKIINKLTIDNVIEVIKFADTHNAEKLKEEAIKFIVLHGKDMKKMPEFKSSLKSLSEDLYYEVIFSFIDHVKLC